MSTKIYYGFLIPVLSLQGIVTRIAPFKEWVNDQAQKKLDAFLAEGCEWGEWLNRRREDKNGQGGDYAVNTEFNIFLLPNPEAKGTLGIISCVNAEWRDQFTQQPGIYEYGYWNNVDKPDSISTRKWKERQQHWSILPYGPITDSMFQLRLVPEFGPIPSHFDKTKTKEE